MKKFIVFSKITEKKYFIEDSEEIHLINRSRSFFLICYLENNEIKQILKNAFNF